MYLEIDLDEWKCRIIYPDDDIHWIEIIYKNKWDIAKTISKKPEITDKLWLWMDGKLYGKWISHEEDIDFKDNLEQYLWDEASKTAMIKMKYWFDDLTRKKKK